MNTRLASMAAVLFDSAPELTPVPAEKTARFADTPVDLIKVSDAIRIPSLEDTAERKLVPGRHYH